MSCAKARKNLSLTEFQEIMRDVWTTSVEADTLDEAPMVYKPMQEIIDNTRDFLEN